MDSKWLSDLEHKVEAAAAEIKTLRKENRAQKNKVKQLQQQLTAARKAGTSEGEWAAERDQIRKRVEKLTSGLEKLL